MIGRSKAEDIATVLKLLGEGRFEYDDRGEGRVAIVFKNYDLPLNELEDFFGLELQDGVLYYGTYEYMVQEWDDKATALLIESYFSGETAERLKEQLRGKPYQEVLNTLYREWWTVQDTSQLGRRFLEGREQLSAPSLEEAEAAIAIHGGEILGEWVARGAATWLGALYPRMLRRAERLRVLPAAECAPAEVQQYLKEATRCYLFGQFLGCAVICRSIVECALRDFLKREGQENSLQSLRAEEGELKGLITLARALRVWRLGPTIDDADEIRRKVNSAVHEKPPGEKECVDLFFKTRGILKELYS